MPKLQRSSFLTLDGELSKAYYNVLAELDYEPFSSLDTEPDFEAGICTFIDDLTPQATPIDYLIGVEPKYKNFMLIQSRIDSFDMDAWRQQPLSRESSPHLKPDSFACAGFFYTGTTDNVMCFWCGLELNHWEATDDPVIEHARFAPKCTWLLRLLGRQRTKYLYLKAIANSVAGTADIQNIKPIDYAFIRDVEDIPGTVDINVLYKSLSGIVDVQLGMYFYIWDFVYVEANQVTVCQFVNFYLHNLQISFHISSTYCRVNR